MEKFSGGENVVYQAVLSGELKIDAEGRIWRLKYRRSHRPGKDGATFTIKRCRKRRAESRLASSGYLMVRLMINGVHHVAMAHRLVWRHFNGEIPPGLTINHKAASGDTTDNRPDNLELATFSEQMLHSYRVLGRKRAGPKDHARDPKTGRFI